MGCLKSKETEVNDIYQGRYVPPHWMKASSLYGCLNGCSWNLPQGAIEAGVDENNETVYVARGKFKNELVPGTLYPNEGCVHVCLEGDVGRLTTYEVLCCMNVTWWKPNKNINKWIQKPPVPVLGYMVNYGMTQLFIGRVKIKKHVVVGFVHEEHQVFYAAYQGKAMTLKKGFEVLIFKGKKRRDSLLY